MMIFPAIFGLAAKPSKRTAKLRAEGIVLFCLALTMGLTTKLVPMAEAQTTSLPVIVADFNHDGIPDALVPSATSPTATIAFGTVPYGTFSSNGKLVPFPEGCTSLTQGGILVGDFNGDGFPDLAFFCGSVAGVVLGNGDGTFGVVNPLSGVSSSTAVVGDFNHDGKLDIVVLASFIGNGNGSSQSLQFFAGKGDGTFAEAVLSNLAQSGYSNPVVADVNGDGYPDIVLGSFSTDADTTPSISVFGYNQGGTFGSIQQGISSPSISVSLSSSTVATSILVGNFFGNGVTDFVVPNTGANPGYFEIQNTSTATTFSLGTPVSVAYAGLQSAMAGSFTGSGFTDLAAANGSTIAVLANDGTGTLSASYSSLSLASTSALFAVADANGDGYADIYTATLPQFGALQLAVNLTSGSATATAQPISLAIGTKAISAAWPGNVNFTGATPSGTQMVVGIPTMTGVTSSKNPSQLGDAVLFTIRVAPATPTASVPTGTAILFDGTTMLASGTLDGTGTFSYMTSALTTATHSITASYAGDAQFASSTSPVLLQVVSHSQSITPNLVWATPAAIAYGTALSGTQLDASAVDANGVAIPGTYTYTPASGTILAPGTYTLNVSFVPTDTVDYANATGSVKLVVTGLSVGSFTPSSATLGAGATTITVTGSGFVATSVVQVNGTAIPTTLVNATTLTAVIPASDLLTVGTLQIAVYDPTVPVTTVGPPFAVIAPAIAATLSGPSTTSPGTQPTVTFTINKPYPVDLTVVLTLSFAASTNPAVDDPAIQFAGGGRTLTFVVPANTTTVPTIQLQSGTVAGTITIPAMLTAGGEDVTPASLLPVVILVPPAVPVITGMTVVSRTGNELTVEIHGFSNTREMVLANFQFTAAPGSQLATPTLTVPAGTIFADWYRSTPSDQYGSAFTYTQIFNTSDGASNVGTVSATLTNTVGASASTTAQ